VWMLSQVASYESKSRMGPRNLAIVFGPNLIHGDERGNPMEALMLSQKAGLLMERLVVRATRLNVFMSVSRPDLSPVSARSGSGEALRARASDGSRAEPVASIDSIEAWEAAVER
jgi:hypothetical protein